RPPSEDAAPPGPPVVAWARELVPLAPDGGALGTLGAALAAHPGGGVFVATSGSGQLGDAIAQDSDAFLVRFDGEGEVVSARAYGGAGNQGATALALDPSGRPWLGVIAYADVGFHARLLRVEESGSKVFVDAPVEQGATDIVWGIAPLSDR